jgi:hypothetical protein
MAAMGTFLSGDWRNDTDNGQWCEYKYRKACKELYAENTIKNICLWKYR